MAGRRVWLRARRAAALGRNGCWSIVGWWLVGDRAWRAPACHAGVLVALVLRSASAWLFRGGASVDGVEALAGGTPVVALAAVLGLSASTLGISGVLSPPDEAELLE